MAIVETQDDGTSPNRLVRWANLLLTGIGAAFFSALFVYVSVAGNDFNERTREFAVNRVIDRVEGELLVGANSETAHHMSNLAERISPELGEEAELLRGIMREGIGPLTIDILAAACRLDCERREAANDAVQGFFEAQRVRYQGAIDTAQRLVVGEYDNAMRELRSDLRIFTLSNFLALAFAFLLSVFRGRSARHLLPVAVILSGSTIVMTIWYIFGQDWVMTILFSEYWGWGYAALLGFMAALLVDIAANRGRITCKVFNAFGGSFSPC